MATQPALTRRRPPAVARALRDTRPPPLQSAAARRAAERRRSQAAARRRRNDSPRTSERAQTLLALVGLGAEHARTVGSWANGRSSALRDGADQVWTDLRARPVWPGVRSAARISLVEAPAWLFHAAAVVMGLGFVLAGAVTAARIALGPTIGPDLVGALLPALLVVLLAMAAVLTALHGLLRGGDDDQRPVWLIGLATVMLVVA
jgi:hypothetical protein